MPQYSQEMLDLQKRAESSGGEIVRWVYRLDLVRRMVTGRKLVGHRIGTPYGFTDEADLVALASSTKSESISRENTGPLGLLD